MKIVYMGTPQFAVPALGALSKSKHQIACVVTGEDKPSGRGKKVQSTPVKLKARELGLSVITPISLKSDEFYEELKAIKPDLIVVIAFRILPERIFELPKFGTINIHGSLLPKYRGAAPIHWAIINGEKETGLTSFFLKKKVDTGDMILQEKTKISEDDTYDTLSERMSEMAGPFLVRTIDLIESGQVKLMKQDEKQASPAPKLTPENCQVDFGFPAENVHNFIRGLSTTPGAYTYFRDQKIKLYQSRLPENTVTNAADSGTILPDKARLLVKCAQSAVELLEVVPEGRKPMDGRSFINGFQPKNGEMMGKIMKVTRG
ncbi:MAG TPA: methionyl-tRNA formyltransferase [candidate division Zixibacteria bacterium]|nr:methionyl-tRNA formyltransferase [candidate division Zixibacteria bacterium]